MSHSNETSKQISFHQQEDGCSSGRIKQFPNTGSGGQIQLFQNVRKKKDTVPPLRAPEDFSENWKYFFL